MLKSKVVIQTPERYIDHTLLRATASEKEILALCHEANAFNFYSVCVNSCWLSTCKKELHSSTAPITVVGFPLGANLAQSKNKECELAILAGAQEIDMVLNIGALKSADWKTVESDIRGVCAVASKFPVKVILETCYLSNDEIIAACKISEQAGALFVKTSTGFGSYGATTEHVALMRQSVSKNIGVKASGGIKNFEDFMKMIDAGATRIGTSHSVKIIEEFKTVGNLS